MCVCVCVCIDFLLPQGVCRVANEVILYNWMILSAFSNLTSHFQDQDLAILIFIMYSTYNNTGHAERVRINLAIIFITFASLFRDPGEYTLLPRTERMHPSLSVVPFIK